MGAGHSEAGGLVLVGLLTARDAEGDTPVHDASFHGHAHVLRLLLQAAPSGLDGQGGGGAGRSCPLTRVLGVQNNDRRTALHLCVFEGHEAAARQLLRAGRAARGGVGTLLRARNGDLDTPLHDAAYKGHVAVVQLLLEEAAREGAGCELGALLAAQTARPAQIPYFASRSVRRALLNASGQCRVTLSRR